MPSHTQNTEVCKLVYDGTSMSSVHWMRSVTFRRWLCWWLSEMIGSERCYAAASHNGPPKINNMYAMYTCVFSRSINYSAAHGYFPSQRDHPPSLVPNYTAWWQRHTGVSSLHQMCHQQGQHTNLCLPKMHTLTSNVTGRRQGPKRRLQAGITMCSTFLQILLILSSAEGYWLQLTIPRAYFVYTVWHCAGQHCSFMYVCVCVSVLVCRYVAPSGDSHYNTVLYNAACVLLLLHRRKNI